MKLIAPVGVKEADIISSTFDTPEHPLWASGTTYGDGDLVHRPSNVVYESQQGNNSNHNPEFDDGTYWLEIGVLKKWQPFDSKISTQAGNPNQIKYTILAPAPITGAAFFNLAATSIRILTKDVEGTTIYDSSETLIDSGNLIDWLTYFTEKPSGVNEILVTDIPCYTGYTIEITITADASTAKVGEIVIGKVETLGETLEDTSIGITDFSEKGQDEYGNFFVVRRPYANNVNFQFQLESRDARRIRNLLASVLAIPCVYFADERRQDFGTMTFGYFKTFDIPLKSGPSSFANLKIEGLT